jgi:hypothetical protein
MSIAGLFGATLRARFVPDDATYAVVDGNRVTCASLSVRSMNFGQHWRGANVPIHRYSITLPVDFFVALLAEPDGLADLIEDTKHHPDPGDPLDQILMAAGFPNADDAVRHPVLAQALAAFYAHDALLRWLGDAGPEVEPVFVLNSCERIAFGSTGLLIEGECRSSGSSTSYQDF